MHADEQFRSQLRSDLRDEAQPPVGALAADALRIGHRMRRRQRTARAVGGMAAVAAVAVGSATLSGAFGSDTGSSVGAAAIPPTSLTSGQTPGTPVASTATPGVTPSPSTRTVPPATKVTDPTWVTPRAIIAELQKILPAGTTTSSLSGSYGYSGGDPRQKWAVTGQLVATTPKGQTHLELTLHKYDAENTSALGCDPTAATCSLTVAKDGSEIEIQHGGAGASQDGASVMVVRPDGMSIQVNVRGATMSDDELFALASNGAWGGLKMEKSFVQHAESTIKGDFMNPPA